MRQIITNTSPNIARAKISFTNQNTGFENMKDVKVTGSVIVGEPNFAEIYDSFECQYQQFLSDTSDEIAKRARRLSELKAFIYRNSPSG